MVDKKNRRKTYVCLTDEGEDARLQAGRRVRIISIGPEGNGRRKDGNVPGTMGGISGPYGEKHTCVLWRNILINNSI